MKIVNQNEVEQEMMALTNKALTSSPSKNDSYLSDEIDVEETSPVKSTTESPQFNNALSLKIDLNQKESPRAIASNGLLAISTPMNQQNLFLRNIMLSIQKPLVNSTPKSIARKPRVNFHSIEDLVGSKSEESSFEDSGYQTNSLTNISNFESPMVTKMDSQKPIQKTCDNFNDTIETENEQDENKEAEKVKQSANGKKVRTTFSDQQKAALDKYFRRNPYPDPKETEDLSCQLSLPENVIKVWFQNKRSRDKQHKASKFVNTQKASINSNFEMNANFAQQLYYQTALNPYVNQLFRTSLM